MSYASLLVSFWRYALETVQYLLNLVPSKVISTTPKKLWTGRKPSLGHVSICGSPAHVLKRDPSKLEARSEVCLFVGYLRGTKDYLFYDPKEQREIVSTNARFLEENYMIDNKPRSKRILDELRAETNEGNEVPIPVTQASPPLFVRTQEPRVPRCSGRVVTQPERFIGLEVLEDPKNDPNNYNEAVQDKDATL